MSAEPNTRFLKRIRCCDGKGATVPCSLPFSRSDTSRLGISTPALASLWRHLHPIAYEQRNVYLPNYIARIPHQLYNKRPLDFCTRIIFNSSTKGLIQDCPNVRPSSHYRDRLKPRDRERHHQRPCAAKHRTPYDHIRDISFRQQHWH
jgi:hypothetical protein